MRLSRNQICDLVTWARANAPTRAGGRANFPKVAGYWVHTFAASGRIPPRVLVQYERDTQHQARGAIIKKIMHRQVRYDRSPTDTSGRLRSSPVAERSSSFLPRLGRCRGRCGSITAHPTRRMEVRTFPLLALPSDTTRGRLSCSSVHKLVYSRPNHECN